MKHQYSAISEHSLVKDTPENIRAWLIASAQDFRVSRFRSPVNASLKVITETSSLQQRIVFPQLNREWCISKTYQDYCRLEEGEWRTEQADLFADTLEPYSEPFTNWGMMRNGVLSGLTIQASGLPTEGNGYGYLPTPDHNEGARGPTKEFDPKAYSQGGRTLTTFAKRHPDKSDTPNTLFHTPTAKANQMSPSEREKGSNYFPTPHANCYTGSNHSDNKQGGMNLQTAVMFPTPTTNEACHPDMELTEAGRRKPTKGKTCHSLNLADTVMNWATPNTFDALPPKSEEAIQRELMIARPGRAKPANLRDQVSNMHNWDGSEADKLVADAGYSLSATWTEALMLWPLDWTSLEPLEDPVWDWTGQDWEPDIPRVVSKQENRTHRLKAIGNGQCPLTMAVAYLILNNIGE